MLQDVEENFRDHNIAAMLICCTYEQAVYKPSIQFYILLQIRISMFPSPASFLLPLMAFNAGLPGTIFGNGTWFKTNLSTIFTAYNDFFLPPGVISTSVGCRRLQPTGAFQMVTEISCLKFSYKLPSQLWRDNRSQGPYIYPLLLRNEPETQANL